MSTPTTTTTSTPWPAPCRRIITSHPPTDTDGSTVHQHVSLVPLTPVLSSNAAITPLFSHSGTPFPVRTPHTLTPTQIDESVSAVPGVVFPGGINGQITELKPKFKVDMHRTNSVDYNIMVQGSAWHITPKEGGGEQRELVRVGDVVVQRGTLHAWEAGDEGARWVCVVVAAEPVRVGGAGEGEGEGEGKVLEEVAF